MRMAKRPISEVMNQAMPIQPWLLPVTVWCSTGWLYSGSSAQPTSPTSVSRAPASIQPLGQSKAAMPKNITNSAVEVKTGQNEELGRWIVFGSTGSGFRPARSQS